MRSSVMVAVVMLGALALPARAEIVISIDKAQQQMIVTVDGDPRYIWPVSTGMAGYDTPVGNFQPFRMERTHFSQEWDDAPMPHSIFFTQDGHAIHGSFAVARLGSPASHGCVRLAPENAATLFDLVKQQGVKNARVVLVGDAALASANPDSIPAIAADEYQAPKRNRSASRNGRDSNRPDFYRAQPYYASRYSRFGGGFPFPYGSW